jgi:hypothetical protein
MYKMASLRPRSGRVTATTWQRLSKANLQDSDLFEIVGDRLHPIYKGGDILLANSKLKVHGGDHVVLRLKNGEVHIVKMVKTTKTSISVATLGNDAERKSFKRAEIAWTGRVIACVKGQHN